MKLPRNGVPDDDQRPAAPWASGAASVESLQEAHSPSHSLCCHFSPPVRLLRFRLRGPLSVRRATSQARRGPPSPPLSVCRGGLHPPLLFPPPASVSRRPKPRPPTLFERVPQPLLLAPAAAPCERCCGWTLGSLPSPRSSVVL